MRYAISTFLITQNMKGYKILTICLLASIAFSSNAQVVSWDVDYNDWNFKKDAVNERKIIPNPILREADVKYSKRIHRIIDTRQKLNRVLTWDANPFTRLIHEGTLNGDYVAYRSDSLFTGSSYTLEEVKERVGINDIIEVQDPDDPENEFATVEKEINEPFEYFNIKKFRLMEDWMFDFKHSVFKPRIIAIAPLYQPMVEGILLDEQPLYWIYMEDLRPDMANFELFNRTNDAARLSVEDFFQMRLFDSYVIKFSNEFDLDINQYEEYDGDNLGVLLKGEEIKNELFIFEHDLWEY